MNASFESPSLGAGSGGGAEGGADPELQQFIQKESELAKFQQQVHNYTDVCWEKCVEGKPGKSLDSRTEMCLNNCVERFIDTTLFIATRFQTKLSGGEQH